MQRLTHDILMNKDGTPKGGKWSFDTENREKIPENVKIPTIYQTKYINNINNINNINTINNMNNIKTL